MTAGGSASRSGRPVGMHRIKDFRGTLARLSSYLGPRKPALVVVIMLSVISTLFSIVSPKIMGKATTRLFEGIMQKAQGVPGAGIDFEYIGRILAILAVLYVASAAFSFLQGFIMAGIAQSTVYEMRKQVQAKLNRLPLKYFDSRPHGEILSRVINDVDAVSSTLQESLVQVISAAVTLVGAFVMMLTISPWLTLVTLVTLPLTAVATWYVTRRSQGYFVGYRKVLGELNGYVEEMYAGHKVVKAFGLEDESINRFDQVNQELYEQGWKSQFLSGLLMPVIGLINNIGYVIVAVAGGLMVWKRTIEIGDIQAFINYSRRFTQPIRQTASIANVIQSTVAAAERIFEILDEEEETPDPEDAVPVPVDLKGEVRFEHVRFGYEEDKVLIEDLNFHAKPGQTIAIVGPTGAGKTTLVNLLMRFYDIDGGRITIDGIDIRDFKRSDLRRLFGMVLQDVWLFSGTIRDNIAYGRENATEEEMVRAAKAARADHFIRTLPDGYDTVLTEDASNLSQGQKQLLTIARGILADPPMMILDEATSNVDTRTEILVQEAMETLMKGRTSFVIAHRLSTIRNADLILVMDDGKIVEQGTHSELLARNGFYAELYYSQFTGRNSETGS
ncbi:MAG: ABC transporter ATP-binding protein [Bacillota bacterium]|nr:ABC transporter ATP-binding protein [Bacillota bacterium]HOP71137.1 ABC transporter ATP-binding protein [Bacillota bacterium]HPT36274.1 ABC transporter ATP-binding protein [Bacillota bacterium]HPZ85969.1 ABC transporter ATP-binding protein [Bacillota bacterium]HQD86322.1 ABC transporter ATP-binding protein [Bacillota bacterium]